MTHISVGKLTISGSDNGLSPGRYQVIIWTNDGTLLIGPLGTNFSEILMEIQIYSLKKIRLKMWSAKCCPFHLGLIVLNTPDSKVHVANMGPIWVLSVSDGPHVGPMNLAIRDNTGLANLCYNWFTCWSGSCFGQAVSSPHSFDSASLGWCLAWWRIYWCYVSMKTRSLPLPPPTMQCWLWCTLLKEQVWFHLKLKRSE